MNTYEYIKYYTQKSIRDNYQISNATIKRVHTNSTYDIVTIIGSDDYPLFNISPVDPKVKFSVGDSVTVLIPVGNKQLTRILGYSNIQFPVEEVIEFNEPVVVLPENIYLCCPDENSIKVYSTDGTAGSEITSLGGDELYFCCTDGTYIYFSFYLGYVIGRVKPDGTDYSSICSAGYYNSIFGLATDGTYLFTAYPYDFSPRVVALSRINIADGTIEDIWKDIAEVMYVDDICNNSTHIFVSGTDFSYVPGIFQYTFDGTYVNFFPTDYEFGRIKADENYVYGLGNYGYALCKYSIAGSKIFETTLTREAESISFDSSGNVYTVTG